MDKAAGFDVSIVLPAVTNSSKLHKKLLSSLPKGSIVVTTPNNNSLIDKNSPYESKLILNK